MMSWPGSYLRNTMAAMTMMGRDVDAPRRQGEPGPFQKKDRVVAALGSLDGVVRAGLNRAR